MLAQSSSGSWYKSARLIASIAGWTARVGGTHRCGLYLTPNADPQHLQRAECVLPPLLGRRAAEEDLVDDDPGAGLRHRGDTRDPRRLQGAELRPSDPRLPGYPSPRLDRVAGGFGAVAAAGRGGPPEGPVGELVDLPPGVLLEAMIMTAFRAGVAQTGPPARLVRRVVLEIAGP